MAHVRDKFYKPKIQRPQPLSAEQIAEIKRLQEAIEQKESKLQK